jgi:hypothetical protein
VIGAVQMPYQSRHARPRTRWLPRAGAGR